MYKGQTGEFIELTNVGNTAVDMTSWSYDDNKRTPGVFDLSDFGTVQPGQSVIITDTTQTQFRSHWSLDPSVKIIPNLGNPSGENLGRDDEINIYDSSGQLVDRLTYADEGVAGGPRTSSVSGNILYDNLGQNNAPSAVLSYINDSFGSYQSSAGDIANPGTYYIASEK